MARLIYSAIMSLDGYIADAGRFEWAAPDEEVHAFVNELERSIDLARLWQAADRNLSVGGAGLAAQAIAAGLVDECQLFVVPAVVGGPGHERDDDQRSQQQRRPPRRAASSRAERVIALSTVALALLASGTSSGRTRRRTRPPMSQPNGSCCEEDAQALVQELSGDGDGDGNGYADAVTAFRVRRVSYSFVPDWLPPPA